MTTPRITRAFQWDLARQVERLDVLLALLPRYAEWGYDELYLHLEDAVEFPRVPGVARADAYSYQDFSRLIAAATRVGIKVVPIVNLLGHTQYLVKVPELRDLNELRAPDGSPLERGQICPLHPRLPELAENLLRDMAPFCTAGKVHVGLDESFHLGKCPRCREEVARIGLAGHFAAHVDRLHAITQKLGLRMGLWADMLAFIPEAIAQLPREVIAYDWYYYAFNRHPRLELFNFAESDLATPLRARGIEYWGCPMNGAFRYEPLPIFKDRLANLRSWWRRCQQTRAGGFLVTSWEAYRLALETTTVVDAAAASLWLEPTMDFADDEAWLARGFARVFGRAGARAAAKAALACDVRAFAGYARWEINDRWDIRARPEQAAIARGVSRRTSVLTKQRAARTVGKLPVPLAASIAFLGYLEARDAFVESCADGVFALRRLMKCSALDVVEPERLRLLEEMTSGARAFAAQLSDGRRAARTMWTRTRDRSQRGQNEAILATDLLRLREWKTWLRAVRRAPGLALEATPVCGRWQLVFTVVNFAPALQKVVVEQVQQDGTWRELRARHTIEFRAEAARPRAQIERMFSTPINEPAAALRLVVRGLGQVAIKGVVLSNGVFTLRATGWPQGRKKILGQSAPTSGFPLINEVGGTCALTFAPERVRTR